MGTCRAQNIKQGNIPNETKLKINESLRWVRDHLTAIVNIDHKCKNNQNASVSDGKETLKSLDKIVNNRRNFLTYGSKDTT